LVTEDLIFGEDCPDILQSKILCSTYRRFPSSSEDFDSIDSIDSILIKEDRGITMGSHLWDSSIVQYEHLKELYTHMPHHLSNQSDQSDQCLKESGDLSLEINAEHAHAHDHTHAHAHAHVHTHARVNNRIAVELGAGCALIGIALAKSNLFHKVYCTDLRNQVPYTRENLYMNNVHGIASAHELNWIDEKSIDAFLHTIGFKHENKHENKHEHNKHEHNNNTTIKDPKPIVHSSAHTIEHTTEHISGSKDITSSSLTDINDSSIPADSNPASRMPADIVDIPSDSSTSDNVTSDTSTSDTIPSHIDVIIASDVLYEVAITASLFSVIRLLSRPRHTVTFLAQKIRGHDPKGSVDVSAIEGFESSIILVEKNVILWKIIAK
jgi:predicted nicotinamide N-methyase